MASKKYIYKYTPLKGAIKILKSNGVLLRHPSKYNDPNDCVFDQDENDKIEIKNLVNDYFFFVVISKLVDSKEITLKGKDKELFDSLRKGFKLMKMMYEKNPYFERIPGLDCVSKMICAQSTKLRNHVSMCNGAFMQKIDKAIEDAKNNTLISCFSKRKDSILMWSHYALSHTGVCIEYLRPSDEEFRDVIYQKQRPSMKLLDAVSRAIAYNILGKKDEEEDYKMVYHKMLEPFFVKSEDWKYEKEVRCLFNKTKPTKKMKKYYKKDILEMSLPTAIYIGCKAGGEDLSLLLKMATDRGIPVYFMKKSETTFDIVVDKDYKYVPGKR